MSDDLPKGQSLSPTSVTGAEGARESATYAGLRNLAAELAPEDKLSAKLIKGQVVSVQTGTGAQVTCTITLGGDASASIPGVRKLDSYSPVAGDVVQVIMQGTEIVILGRIDQPTSSLAVNGWVVPSLGSGFTATANTPQYRVVNDNGDRKIQLRGTISVSGSPTTLWTMPAGLRPLLFKLVLCGRDSGGGSNVVQIGINTSGTMTLEGRTTGLWGVSGSSAGRQTDVGGGTASVVEQTTDPTTSANGFLSGGRAATSGSTISMDHNLATNEQMNAHQHHFNHRHNVTVNGLSHQHPMSPVDSPSVVYLDGVEYFL